MTTVSVNILLSYAYHKGTNLHQVRAGMGCGRILIDSGAFTAHTTGRVITVPEYAEFLNEYQGAWDHAVTLDVIGDPAQSKVNTHRLHTQGINVMPVFTAGESIKEFDAMVRDSKYVCVGGGVGMKQVLQEKRAFLLQRRAEDLGGGIHALGIGAISSLRRVRPYSADASNISNCFTYGAVPYFNGRTIPTPSMTEVAKIRAALPHLLAHDINVAKILRERRVPGMHEGKKDMCHKFHLAYAAADEYLRKHNQVPVPQGVSDTTGTHLYSSIAPLWMVRETVRLDGDLHNGYAPLVWRRYGSQHDCGLRARPHITQEEMKEA